jgi:hypothetical protein
MFIWMMLKMLNLSWQLDIIDESSDFHSVGAYLA